jgi:hypothetical protein
MVGSAAAALGRPGGYPTLVAAFCLWQGIFAALAAVFRRDKHGAPCLTAWDEAAAFIALALLTRIVGEEGP